MKVDDIDKWFYLFEIIMITVLLDDPISAAVVPLILSRLRENNRDGRECLTMLMMQRIENCFLGCRCRSIM